MLNLKFGCLFVQNHAADRISRHCLALPPHDHERIVFFAFNSFPASVTYCLMEKPHIQSVCKRIEKSQFVEDFGDVGYGVGLVSV